MLSPKPPECAILSSSAIANRIALVGPTASGKTAVAVHLAQHLGAEIVSADSMQVYRYMDIGTAKPTSKEQAQAVFYAIDVADPDQEWTLADYQRLGEAACAEISERGSIPLLVGGTGLYIRALTTRLDIPPAPPDEEFRARWRGFALEHGNEALLAQVGKIDPETAARLHVNDIGRQIRALEVFAATGRTMTDLHAENQANQSPEQPILFGLHFADRDHLYDRIDTRVDLMLASGFLEEVRGLRERGYAASLKAMQALGYRQINAFLAGDLLWDAAVAEIKQETRRFSKRQLIWFRGDKRVRWITADGRTPEQLADEISKIIICANEEDNRNP